MVYEDEAEAVSVYGLPARGRTPIRVGIFRERGVFVHAARCRHDRSIFEPCPGCEEVDQRAGDALRLSAQIADELATPYWRHPDIVKQDVRDEAVAILLAGLDVGSISELGRLVALGRTAEER